MIRRAALLLGNGLSFVEPLAFKHPHVTTGAEINNPLTFEE
jgi:hypothetical protein